MVQFKGFKTKEEAKDFIKKNGKGVLCYEKSAVEKRGYNTQYYKDCVVYGGLSKEYPYAVQWNI